MGENVVDDDVVVRPQLGKAQVNQPDLEDEVVRFDAMGIAHLGLSFILTSFNTIWRG